HLVFSQSHLLTKGSRYRVTKRTTLNESKILLTPYVDETRIDVEALEAFINEQYKNARIRRDEVDTGALILTGVAVRRRNARAIAELFAQEAERSSGEGPVADSKPRWRHMVPARRLIPPKPAGSS